MMFALRMLVVLSAALACLTALGHDPEAISPTNAPVQLFNGRNLGGLYTWLSDTGYEDPRGVFSVENGMLHISGDGMGYICTKERYQNYHLVVEYRWGDRTWQSRKTNARDTGVVVHCVEPDGSFGNIFMAGIEAQTIEGGVGDLLVVPGKRADGSDIPVALTAEIVKDRDGENVWKKGGQRTTFNSFGRINWYGRDPDWTDTLGFRGPEDLDCPGKEWTRLDVICEGGHVVYRVNGIQANEGFDSMPSSGKILIQAELAEVWVRRFELLPLNKDYGEGTR